MLCESALPDRERGNLMFRLLLVCSGGYTSSTVARRIAEYIETNRLLYEVKKHQCGGRPAALPGIRSDSSGAAGLFCL